MSCAVSGRLDAFGEDDVVEFRRTVWPSPETGWRGETVLVSETEAFAMVELLTVFARRDGASNTRLVRAAVADDMAPRVDVSTCRRANVLRAVARAERAAAEAVEAPPHLSIRIGHEAHTNGVDLLYFATFFTAFGTGEQICFAAPEGPVLQTRKMHFYGNIDVGDTLDVTRGPTSCHPDRPCGIAIGSVARRRSDGRLVASCRSRFEVSDETAVDRDDCTNCEELGPEGRAASFIVSTGWACPRNSGVSFRGSSFLPMSPDETRLERVRAHRQAAP
jgi:probable biosynthetic protein (TIGR04098 family)